MISASAGMPYEVSILHPHHYAAFSFTSSRQIPLGINDILSKATKSQIAAVVIE
jgi:hypothetical protein